MKDSFKDRESKWGWVTGTQDIMNNQIKLASDAGLHFFSFCWYYNKKDDHGLNNAVELYLNSPNNAKLKYCLLVANHKGFEIGPEDWPIVVDKWLRYFRKNTYLKVGGKPFITFFDLDGLLKKFGSSVAVNKAFAELKDKASKEGLNGVTIAINTHGDKWTVKMAEECGADILTGYNYHTAAFGNRSKQRIPIDNLIEEERKVWNKITTASKLPYIPVATLNWDPRPWANGSNKFASDPYYTGFSKKSVYNSVKSIVNWIADNPGRTSQEKVALLYAWNEYGEGAWLTPSKRNNKKLLEGVTAALND